MDAATEETREEIRYATGECVLGIVLVATSERGVCAILLGDDAGRLARDLRRQFPQARLSDVGTALEPLVAKVEKFVGESATALDVPLDVRGTAFQQRVWRALQQIPPGSTESYAEVARRLGTPGSAKDVGEACAANALAVVIPCHRVVRTDGGLGGYRGGVKRKRLLLEREGARIIETADLFESPQA